jgi:protein-L-isoaspartate O-methyltransferase
VPEARHRRAYDDTPLPVGSVFGTQSLMLVEKDEKDQVRTTSLMAVRFVPLMRKGASKP